MITSHDLTMRRTGRWHQHRAGDQVAEHVAREAGVEVATAHAWMFGAGRANLRAAAIIAAFQACNQPQRLYRWASPIEAALKGILSPRESPGLTLQAATADQDEDVVEVAYLLNPSPATALQLLRAIDTERALQLERRQALVARWELPC